MEDRETNMWRFILGIGCGIAMTVMVTFTLPVKWEEDPEKKNIGKAHDKLTVVIGTDETLDYVSQCRSTDHDGQRVIHIFQRQQDADACKARVLEQATKQK